MIRFSLLVALCCSGISYSAEPCISGIPVGQRPGPYSFLVATGPQRGQQTCYVCETGDNPGCVIFARKVSDSLGQLLLKIEPVVSREKSPIKTWMTILGEKTISIDNLGQWSKAQGLKSIPVGIFDDEDGPPSYKISQDAEITVLIFNQKKVVNNFAFRSGELNEKSIKQIVESLSNLEKK
ncbi:MAG: hypothetical protein N2112_15720 [Gemmataceae bacterium]|jgi:hypothetical protein|nr:hypothetical protein [Gemmataceae bacterium]